MTVVLLPQLSRATRTLSLHTVPRRSIRTAAATAVSCSVIASRHSIQDVTSCGGYPRQSASRSRSRLVSTSLRHSSSSSSSSTTSSSINSGGASSTDASANKTHYPDDKHVLNKDDTLDIQSENSVKGRESRAQSKGGQATTEKDTRANAEKAKKDYPEAPDTVIGMQDERGGKGY